MAGGKNINNPNKVFLKRLAALTGMWLVFSALGITSIFAGDDSLVITVSIIDNMAPDPVTDLTASTGINENEIDLSWTAPADVPEGNSVTTYVVRYSTNSCDDSPFLGDKEAWWSQAVDVSNEPQVPADPGQTEQITVYELAGGTTYYFGIKSRDLEANESDIDTTSPQAFAYAQDDVVPPDAVSDLAVSGVTGDSVTLIWTSPGDDGIIKDLLNGEYEIRWSVDGPILDMSGWDAAGPGMVSAANIPQGAADTRTVGGLSSDVVYWFVLRVRDDSGNWSGLSNCASAATSDVIEPLITSFYPPHGSVGLSEGIVPMVTFNDVMLDTGGHPVTLTAVRNNLGVRIEQPVEGACVYNGNEISFSPGSPLTKGYVYQAAVTRDAVDEGGNRVRREFTWNFKTILDHTVRNVVITSDEERTKMGLDPYAMEADGYVKINLDPLLQPQEVDSLVITEANQNVENARIVNRHRYPILNTMREFNIYLGYYASGNPNSEENFGADVDILMPYPDDDNDGYVDGTSPPVFEQTLCVYQLNESNGRWERLPDSRVNDSDKVVSARVPHASVYVLMGGSYMELCDAFAYPVPYKPHDGRADTGSPDSGITFANLPYHVTIRILNIKC